MSVICFDLSLSNTGVAVFSNDGKLEELISIETSKLDETPLRLQHIAKEMKKIKKKYNPNTIVVENCFSRFNISTQMLYRVRGLTEYLFADCKQYYFHATMVRKTLTGKGNMKKDELRDFIIKSNPEIEFADFDQSDAYSLGKCFFIKQKEDNKINYKEEI